MAITKEKFDQARDAIDAIQEILSEMGIIIATADRAILEDKEGNSKVSLTGSQKTQLLAEFDKAKTKLTTAYGELP